MLRAERLSPEIIDERIAKIVKRLKEKEFLKGTVFEARAMQMNVDPYSLLLGVLLGMALTIVLGMATIEIWLPRALSRITGKAISEARRAVTEALRS
jgi:hypothetical protein